MLLWSTAASAQLPPARTIVLTGSAPPDTSGGVVFSDFTATMCPDGRVAVEGTLSGTGISGDNDRGVWAAGADNVMVTIAREGSQAPELGGLTLSGILGGVYPSRIIGYKGFLEGSGVTIYNNLASFAGDRLVHRFEEQAPGLDPGVTWNGAITDVNPGGRFLVFGALSGPGIDSTNDDILYQWSNGSFTELLRLGDAADGGGTFADFTLEFGFNRDSVVSFRAAAEDPPGVFTNGLWVGSSGSYQLVAKVGQTIATPTGSLILEALQVAPSLNERGQLLAFTGLVSGSLKGLWIYNGSVMVRPVALENTAIGGYTAMDLGAPAIAEDSVAFLAYLAVVSQGIVVDTPTSQTLIAKGGDPAPGAPAGTSFESFSTPAINSLGQVVFEAQLTGTETGEGIWLWSTDGELQPVAITGQPLWISPSDMRTPTSLGFSGGSAGQGGGVSLTDNGLILFHARFGDGVKAALTSDPENIGIWASGFETGDVTSWSSSTG